MILVNEDFKDLELGEFPYDRGHSALGEYHYFKHKGNYGNWFDPISLHQWRSTDGSWLVTSDGDTRYMEQNRGDNTKGAFENVYCCLIHNQKIYSTYTLGFDIRLFEFNKYAGVTFNYLTSRNNLFVGIDGKTLVLHKRYQEDFDVIKRIDFNASDLETYHFKIIVSNNLKVFVDEKLLIEAKVDYKEGLSFGLCAKSCARYSNVKVSLSDEEYKKHLNNIEAEEKRLEEKRKQYPKLKCIKKINLGNFSSGRQLRIARVDGKTLFLMAQHQKRYIRDSFARLSCLTCFDIDGNVLWQKGEANNSFDNTLISCDLPFQIADINGDGKLEVIYSMDFYVIICDLLTGNIINKMPTPIIKDDPLVKNEPYYRLNVDAIRVADFSGLGYKGDFIIKDRYQNVWAYSYKDFKLLWRYNHKNTGHFPYIYDFDNDGRDEMFVGYDMIDHDGKMVFSLPMNSDHTDEIIYASLNKNEPKRLILASGNEGFNIVNLDGSIYKHNEIGHAQRISVAKYLDIEGLQICVTAFWGSDGIVAMYDYKGDLICEMEQKSNGNVITPVNYDGKHILCLLNASADGGLCDGYLDKVVKFPIDGHPDISTEVYDIDGDGIDEILCWDLENMWIYKAESFEKAKKFEKYPDEGFSNYRGEYLLPIE